MPISKHEVWLKRKSLFKHFIMNFSSNPLFLFNLFCFLKFEFLQENKTPTKDFPFTLLSQLGVEHCHNLMYWSIFKYISKVGITF